VVHQVGIKQEALEVQVVEIQVIIMQVLVQQLVLVQLVKDMQVVHQIHQGMVLQVVVVEQVQ
jgi:hypothetical protein